MTSPLAQIFSTIESVKRRAADMLANPVQTYKNNVNAANTGAGEHLQALRATIDPQGNPNPAAVDKATQDLVNFGSNFNMAGILAGPRAKGINNIALAMAMKDQRKGRNPADIWAEHGWGKGPDGFWRTEINDQLSENKLFPIDKFVSRGKGGHLGPLEESFSHPEFAKAYPEIWRGTYAQTELNGYKPAPWAEGSFSAYPARNGTGDLRMTGGSDDSLRAGILHELQHAVQTKEGFAPGGNPSMFKLVPEEDKRLNLYRQLAGEAEARLVENRMNMGPKARRAIFPFDPDYFNTATKVDVNRLIDLNRLPADSIYIP